MTTTQRNASAQSQQDFVRIQDILYLCLCKWYWFVLSLAVCLGVAIWYILITPPVYTRSASILIKDESQGKSSSSGLEQFGDFGMFTSSTNIYNEIGTLQSPDLMREVVARLHLDMDYKVPGRFHNQTVYGRQLPVCVRIEGMEEKQSATFTLQLTKDGGVTLSDIARGGELLGETVLKGHLGDTVKSVIGDIIVTPTSYYDNGTESLLYVSKLPFSGIASAYSGALTVDKTDKGSDIIALSLRDISPQRAEDVLNTLISIYNENWVSDKNRLAVSTSKFIDSRLGVIERELGSVDDDISSYKSEHLLPDVQAAAGIYLAQANEAKATVREIDNQLYMVRHIRNYLTDSGNNFRLLPTNSGISDSNLSAQISQYNSKMLDRNSLVAHSSEKNPLVVEFDATLAALRSALLTSIDNQIVALNAQKKSQQSVGGQATSQIASNPQQAKYLLSVERQQKVKESLYL